jgi:hypothetical protein
MAIEQVKAPGQEGSSSSPQAPEAGVWLPPLPAAAPPLWQGAFFDVVLGGLVLLLGFLLAAIPARSADIWIHLAAGKLLWQGQYHFGADPFAHTTGGAVWVNPSWLYDALTYAAYRGAGGAGLAALKALLVALLGAALLRASSAGRGLWGPALCSGLALLAVGLRVPLQPVCVSLLALALTLGFLERGLRRHAAGVSALAAYWPLLPLFALWVNLDAWFLLGPAAVALYALGSLLRGDRRAAAALGLTLLAGLAACLVNPHGIRAFAWPNDLGLSPAAAALAGDPLGRELVVSPLSSEFLHSGLARSPAGVAYFALAFLGLISFLVSLRDRPWPRLLLWAALLALSLYQWRAIPLFAVVAGPVLALNLQAAARRAELSRGAPESRPTLGLLAFTALAGVLVLVVAWPGWLQPPPYEPRRLAVESEPSLERAAERIAQWRRDGRLTDGDQGFNFSPEAAGYFAWACPEEKSFLDGRLSLFPAEAAEDYAAVRRALLGQEGAPDRDWRAVLRRRHVNHVILYDREAERLGRVLYRLYRNPQEWPLLYEDGRTLIFGWRDPQRPSQPDAFAGMAADLDRAAFHPADEQKAPTAWPGRPPQPPGWLDPFVKPRPPRSLDRDEASVYLMQFDAIAADGLGRHTLAFEGAAAGGIVAATVGAMPGPASDIDLALRLRLAGMFPAKPAPGKQAEPAALDVLAQHLLNADVFSREDAPTGLLLLAVRSARRALRDTPDDASAYFILGEAYLRLANYTPERVWGDRLPQLRRVRQVQASAAFNQALLLDPDHLPSHERLARLYGDMRFADLRLKHLKETKRLAHAARPDPREPPEQRAERLARLDEEVKAFEEQVNKATDLYEANARNLKVIDRARAAFEKHLAGKALEVLEGSDVAAFGPPGMQLELELFLSTGRVREVREWMDSEQRDVLGPANYAWIQALMKAATGDYAAADDDLATIAALPVQVEQAGSISFPPRDALALAAATAVLNGPLGDQGPAQFLRTALGAPHLRALTSGLGAELARQADLKVLRGVLAVEEGASALAEALFREALALWGSDAAAASGAGIDFPARLIAQEYLRWLTARSPTP